MLTTQRLLTDLWATWRLVVMLKSTRTISSSDRQWLEESDANLRSMGAPIAAARPYQPWLKRPRYKAGKRA